MSNEEGAEEQKQDVAGWASELAKGFSWMYQRSLLRPNDDWETFEDLLAHIKEMIEKREGELVALSLGRRELELSSLVLRATLADPLSAFWSHFSRTELLGLCQKIHEVISDKPIEQGDSVASVLLAATSTSSFFSSLLPFSRLLPDGSDPEEDAASAGEDVDQPQQQS